MAVQKGKIKVLVIGADGVARKNYCDHDAEFFENKYKIDQDAIYQSLDGFWIFAKPVPTIMFRQNNVIAISFKVKPSIPDPDEMGSSISRAAWAIAELMRKAESNAQTFIMILLVLACLLAGASTYMTYSLGKEVVNLKAQVDQMQAIISFQSTPITTGTTNTGQNIGIRVATPIPTSTVVPTFTPLIIPPPR